MVMEQDMQLLNMHKILVLFFLKLFVILFITQKKNRELRF